mgnify:CR=1 FL=1
MGDVSTTVPLSLSDTTPLLPGYGDSIAHFTLLRKYYDLVICTARPHDDKSAVEQMRILQLRIHFFHGNIVDIQPTTLLDETSCFACGEYLERTS